MVQGDGLHSEEHMWATVCKWKSNRLPLPIINSEVSMVSVFQISAQFIFTETASSCKVLGGQGFLGRAQEPFPPAGMEQRAAEMDLQERKVKFHRDKWPSY